MEAGELTISITILANAVASQLSDERLGLTAAIFTQIGDTLATIAVQRTIKNNSNDSSKSNQ